MSIYNKGKNMSACQEFITTNYCVGNIIAVICLPNREDRVQMQTYLQRIGIDARFMDYRGMTDCRNGKAVSIASKRNKIPVAVGAVGVSGDWHVYINGDKVV